MAMALAELPTAGVTRMPSTLATFRGHRRTFEQAGLTVDHRYAFTDDGLHIVEKDTGRVFHRDRWATRGR